MMAQLYFLTVFVSMFCVIYGVVTSRPQCAVILDEHGLVGKIAILLVAMGMLVILCFVPLLNLLIIIGAFKEVR